MKRFFYQYFCLLYSAFTAFISVAFIFAIVEQILIDMEAKVYGQTIIIVIIAFLSLYVLSIPEKIIRGVKFGNFFIDCLNVTLVSPFRVIFQIITIIRLHILANKGDTNFGHRVKLEKYGTVDVYYLLFNSERLRKKPKSEKQLYYEYLVNKMNKELDDANHFLTVNKRSDGMYNVYIVPLCAVSANQFYTFSVQNNSYTGNRYISELYVNGHKIIEMNFENTLVLSLRPGTYDFKLKVEGNVKSTQFLEADTKISKTFTLKNVSVGNEDVYLCVSMAFAPVYTEYRNVSSGNVVKEEFEYFKQRYQFSRVSLQTLNALCDYWMAYKTNVDQVYTQLSAQRFMNKNK